MTNETALSLPITSGVLYFLPRRPFHNAGQYLYDQCDRASSSLLQIASDT